MAALLYLNENEKNNPHFSLPKILFVAVFREEDLFHSGGTIGFNVCRHDLESREFPPGVLQPGMVRRMPRAWGHCIGLARAKHNSNWFPGFPRRSFGKTP